MIKVTKGQKFKDSKTNEGYYAIMIKINLAFGYSKCHPWKKCQYRCCCELFEIVMVMTTKTGFNRYESKMKMICICMVQSFSINRTHRCMHQCLSIGFLCIPKKKEENLIVSILSKFHRSHPDFSFFFLNK